VYKYRKGVNFMKFFKSRKGNKFITETSESVKEIINQLPSDASNVKIFKSNNGGIHSHKIHFFVTFQSTIVKTTEKATLWDGHNGKWASFIPKWKIDEVEEEKRRVEESFWKIAWEDGRF